MTVIIKLAEYVVPYFDVTVALAAYGTSWLTAAVLLTSVVVDLRTWAARTGTMLPEVVFLTKTENSLWCNTNLLVPDIKCFIIILLNRRIQTIRI